MLWPIEYIRCGAAWPPRMVTKARLPHGSFSLWMLAHGIQPPCCKEAQATWRGHTTALQPTTPADSPDRPADMRVSWPAEGSSPQTSSPQVRPQDILEQRQTISSMPGMNSWPTEMVRGSDYCCSKALRFGTWANYLPLFCCNLCILYDFQIKQMR